MEQKAQLQLQLMAEREQRDKNEQKWAALEQKLKKYQEITIENKRKQKIIQDKTAEVIKLRDEVEQYKEKAKERDQIYNKNKELVTR